MVVLKEVFEKVDFEKKSADNKKSCLFVSFFNLPVNSYGHVMY